jgi:hypothetical protein
MGRVGQVERARQVGSWDGLFCDWAIADCMIERINARSEKSFPVATALGTRRTQRACEPGPPRCGLCIVGWDGAERGVGVPASDRGAPTARTLRRAMVRAGVRGGAPG